ncbi:hypothetical protein TNCV_845131 [Trichonephila clavipes]|uniref:Uncharacterized protein n=1 Tax=Trichonephila clavipes TaxID=2585209 RepID=A0A8X7BKS6_TRICX|nr:hypothetical protein TNCV_845131 [Trichonephila clavipes]
MFDPSSFAKPTPLAHADTSRDVLPSGVHYLITLKTTMRSYHNWKAYFPPGSSEHRNSYPPTRLGVGHLLAVACGTNLPIGFSVPLRRLFLKIFVSRDNSCRVR